MKNQTNKKINNSVKKNTTTKESKKVESKKVESKKTESKKIENKDIKGQAKIETQKIDNLGILIQLVLSIVLIIFIVYSIFITEFYNLTVGLLTALAFTMAYNNHTTYKRKNFTAIYLVIGIAGIAFLIGTLF